MILAILAGVFWKDIASISLILVILGIIVGVLNITDRDIMPFLIAAVALVVVGSGSFTILNEIVNYIARFMVPAAIISAVRSMWRLAQPT